MRRMIEASTKEILKIFRDTVLCERYTNIEGLFQRLDPRVKFLATIALIITAVASGKIIIQLAILVLTFLLALISRISFKFFIVRTFLFIPLFAVVIALPLPFIISGEIVASFKINGMLIMVSREGLWEMLIFVLRVWACVSLSILLILTTKWNSLLHGLSKLHAPRLLIVILNMTYRYIYFFTDMLYKMLIARESRLTGPVGTLEAIKGGASALGSLFIRAYEKGEKIYLAMKSRGYNGEMKTMDDLKIHKLDIIFSVLVGAIIVMMLVMQMFHEFPFPVF